MISRYLKTTIFVVAGVFLPGILSAQGIGGEINSFQSVLDRLYDEMIPLCGQLIGVARGLAGFAAMWFIASRVWRHIANAEAVDFYPLLRPFALGLAILMFPSVLTLINMVLKPTVTGTASMVDGTNNAIAFLLKRKEEAIRKTPAWQMYVGMVKCLRSALWCWYTHKSKIFFENIFSDFRQTFAGQSAGQLKRNQKAPKNFEAFNRLNIKSYLRPESNRHARRHTILSRARLPVPPLRHLMLQCW